MDLPDFLARTAHGGIRLTGHRIGLEHVVERFREGWSPEMIAGEFPTVPLALVYKVCAFYLENRAEVDEYVRRLDEGFERLSASGHHLNVAQLRERLEAIRRAQDRPAGG